MNGVQGIDFIQATAEDIPDLGLPPMRLVTFGQSFHRTDRGPVAESVYSVLEPGGAIALVVHDIDIHSTATGTGDPTIPDHEVQALISRYLGAERRSGQRPASWYRSECHAPGRPNVTGDVDGAISGDLSTSYAAPHMFGDRLDAFVADLRRLLEPRTPTGRFWDSPGDTAAIVAYKPG